MKTTIKINRPRLGDRHAAFRFRRQVDIEALIESGCRVPEYIIVSPDDHIADMQLGRRRAKFHAGDGDLMVRRRGNPVARPK
ncbi:hypothetical protein HFN69_32410 [Rhizobium laguerreae]|nr:hypothetical protein [Rhizobium laguerreae]MBY3551227.1 hypothetical protein [Rhizobium laguerreae]